MPALLFVGRMRCTAPAFQALHAAARWRPTLQGTPRDLLQNQPDAGQSPFRRDYQDPTPVQAAVLADEALGRDVLVSAQTGSGKTVAYGLAMAATIMGEDEVLRETETPLALIVAPTRELALQVEKELTWLYEFARARIVSCVGGMDARTERRRLSDGAHIVVGTPGRLRDHIERGSLDLSGLRAIVLDEADEMMALGFREDLEFILDATPPEKRALLFSATMPKAIATLAKRYQRDALRIEVANDEKGHADIEYRAIRVAPKETELAVVNLLRFFEAQTSIVFCNTRESVRHLQATLQERGFNAVLLSGELSQHERNQSMQALRDGRARVCVATDVAARGLDLPNLGLVIHAELPHDAEVLQHRSGRTGRAGKKGISAILVPPARRRRAEQLLRDAGVSVTWAGPPSAEDIRTLDQQRMLQDPMLTEEPSEDDLAMARLLLAERTPEHVAAALVRIYHSRLPSLEEVVDPGQGPEPREPRGPNGRPLKQSSAPWAEISADAVWFRLKIGRKQNADPKWLLPMLCRKGGVNRGDIGAIRIFDVDTRVEISGSVAEGFFTAMRKPGGENIAIEMITDGSQLANTNAPDDGYREKKRDRRPPETFAKGPHAKGPYGKERPPREEREPREPREPYAKREAPPRDRPARAYDPRDIAPQEERVYAPSPGKPSGKDKGKRNKPHGPRTETDARPDSRKEGSGAKPFGKKPFGKKPFGGKPDHDGRPPKKKEFRKPHG